MHIAEISSGPGHLALQVNPAAFAVRAFTKNRIPHGAALVLNANYYWEANHIGRMFDQGRFMPGLVSFAGVRPLLVLERTAHILEARVVDFAQIRRETVVQAGPTLVWDGKVALGTVREGFRPDAVRKAAHVAVGVTAAHKLLAVYVSSMGAAELARLMADLGAVRAMKLDGGHAAVMRWGSRRLGNPGYVPTGIAFVRG